MYNPRITSVFAGGDAAVLLLSKVDQVDVEPVCLKSNPDTRSPIKKFWHRITMTDKEDANDEARTRAFYFATDTAFGVKVAWKGTGGPYPTSLKLGYNRTEFAYPPIDVSENECGDEGSSGQWEVKVPSFFASLDNNSQFYVPFGDEDTGTTHVQFFATGAVAREWAKHDSVKKATFKTMAPEAAEIKTTGDASRATTITLLNGI